MGAAEKYDEGPEFMLLGPSALDLAKYNFRHYWDWAIKGLCRNEKQQKHFNDNGNTTMAKFICQICPSNLDCLLWALIHNEDSGVWGGLTAKERKDLFNRSFRSKAAAAAKAQNKYYDKVDLGKFTVMLCLQKPFYPKP